MKSRVHVLVSNYIQGPQVAVQGGHALVNLLIDYGSNRDLLDWAQYDQTLIYLRHSDLLGFRTKWNKLFYGLDSQPKSYPLSSFKEPDLNDTMTAIAFLLPEFPEDYIPFTRNEHDLYEFWKEVKQFRLVA